MSGNPSNIISSYAELLRRRLDIDNLEAAPLSTAFAEVDPARPCALIFSPHPDDECLVGALPIRLLREEKWQIINVAITLGSHKARQVARREELAQACAHLTFSCVLSDELGFLDVTLEAKEREPARWSLKCKRLAEIIEHYGPSALFLPHSDDGHPTHRGTHALVLDALSMMSSGFSTTLFETEYWQNLPEPNLLVGIGEKDAASLLGALAHHRGENARNAFDLRFPAYLVDAVRRGSERVSGDGAPSAATEFAMLYRKGLWRAGKHTVSALKRIIDPTNSLQDLLP